MDVAILAGGRSSRFAAADGRPKALAVVGGRTMLDHVIGRYTTAGLHRIVVALGHHEEQIRDHLTRSGRVVAGDGYVDVHRDRAVIRLVNTGRDTATGGRVARLAPHLDGTFHLAWCDGLTELDPHDLMSSHTTSGARATVAAVHPTTRFGRLELRDDRVVRFDEKPHLDDVWVSAGVFVVDPIVLAHVTDDATSWEHDVLPRLAKDGELAAFRHEGFWFPVDTHDDLTALRRLYRRSGALWESAR